MNETNLNNSRSAFAGEKKTPHTNMEIFTRNHRLLSKSKSFQISAHLPIILFGENRKQQPA